MAVEAESYLETVMKGSNNGCEESEQNDAGGLNTEPHACRIFDNISVIPSRRSTGIWLRFRSATEAMLDRNLTTKAKFFKNLPLPRA
jgi:hypothetical protein